MTLSDLLRFNPITIQCHDNPDADALAAALGLYKFFESKGKTVRMVYSGRFEIQKANLSLMKNKLSLPIEYISPEDKTKIEGLLITVDCQYGAGNVTRLESDFVAIIDHHQIEITDQPLSRIEPRLGSCATLVWSMLKEEAYPVEEDMVLGTALYYGLYTDTNQLSELFHPLDLDMRDSLEYNKSLINQFRNSNLSLKELEIAGIAMIRYSYNDGYRFAVIKSKPCDPNILGLISDFLLQVDEIDVCLVYNETGDGYKLSVRSCIKEVNANELAAYLTKGIGNGGGHLEKAGGFISKKLYEKVHGATHSEAYFNTAMTAYFEEYPVVYAKDYTYQPEGAEIFVHKVRSYGYVRVKDLPGIGRWSVIRTMEGELEIETSDDLYLVLDAQGRVEYKTHEQMQAYYHCMEDSFAVEGNMAEKAYRPIMKRKSDGKAYSLVDFARLCVPQKEKQIYVKRLEDGIKIFPVWDEERYQLGMPGDYLAAYKDNTSHVFILPKELLKENYERA